ncbi:MAG: glutamate--tRNA ligase [Dysgonamonadaceae bacterium]|jgi:glutamyl-tRNA synthetase|nr:glutamate--tRNA ligase [Dysgonamonadaceae bacterium]
MNPKVRVRFAPSPTGPLHIGGVRTALYNYLYAKQYGGDFILRIEDTDSQRFVAGAENYIQETFDWLGLPFDESPKKGGIHAPYRQSERKEIYKKYVQQLLDDGKAYIAFDTPEELTEKREEIANFQYDASTRLQMHNSLTMFAEEVETLKANGAQYVVRIKIEPDIDITVNDLIRGEVIINSSVLDDKVLYKSADELPTYHLANVVDDHLMEISHVIRGEEWLPSAPLHVWLYKSFGWEETMPKFAHLPLLLKPEGNGKLSKRDGDRLGFPVFPLLWKDPKTDETSSGYRESGYLAPAVINFLAFLGWNPGTEQEIFSLDELVHAFSFERCSKSGAKFDFEKAKWYNHFYIGNTPNEELAQMFAPVLAEHGVNASPEFTAKVIGLVKERVSFVQELWNQASFFFVAPTIYDEKALKKRWKENTPTEMSELAEVLLGIDNFSSENQEVIVKKWIEEKGYHLGNIMNTFRLAIVGEGKGPHMFDITALIGKEETIKRINVLINNVPMASTMSIN